MKPHHRSLSCLLGSFVLVTCALAAEVDPLANPPSPAFEGQTAAAAPVDPSRIQVEVIATDLDQPRSLQPLPDGRLLVTEGLGTVRILSTTGDISEPLPGMPEILSVGSRSMNDFVLDSDFANNRYVYFTYQGPAPGQQGGPRTTAERTAALQSGTPFTLDRVARARLADDYSRIEDVQVIAEVHGRRLVHAPDGTLFITMMGHDVLTDVQKLQSSKGKVLRINRDGSIPADNPYVGRDMVRQDLYSTGHRDPDGAFIHPRTGELWMIEHGPMGGDELNIVRPGLNYGWPIISYGKNYDGTEIGHSWQHGMEQPLYYWFPSVAPSGLLVYTGELFPAWQGSVFLGTMSPTQGKFLVRLVVLDERVMMEEHLLVEHDRRVRAVTQGTDGAIYVLTDSENNAQTGRRFPGEVLKLTPAGN
jgi:aldose sugar dehydrogenase